MGHSLPVPGYSRSMWPFFEGYADYCILRFCFTVKANIYGCGLYYFPPFFLLDANTVVCSISMTAKHSHRYKFENNSFSLCYFFSLYSVFSISRFYFFQILLHSLCFHCFSLIFLSCFFFSLSFWISSKGEVSRNNICLKVNL